MTLIPIEALIEQVAGRLDQSPCDGCDACGTRCTAGIQVLQSEYRAIRGELARLPGGEVARVLGQERRVPIPGTEEQYTACRFRDVERGRCLIYRARPAICRLFGHVEWLPCPIFKITSHAPDAVGLMQVYAGERRQTFEEWEAVFDCNEPAI
jgi:Fe-S-cluster containining protein